MSWRKFIHRFGDFLSLLCHSRRVSFATSGQQVFGFLYWRYVCIESYTVTSSTLASSVFDGKIPFQFVSLFTALYWIPTHMQSLEVSHGIQAEIILRFWVSPCLWLSHVQDFPLSFNLPCHLELHCATPSSKGRDVLLLRLW